MYSWKPEFDISAFLNPCTFSFETASLIEPGALRFVLAWLSDKPRGPPDGMSPEQAAKMYHHVWLFLMGVRG